ncbi:uncharacterized protein LOC116258075 isoform X4 [Nymphaea colorata]|uniref:uncharacterized protein LOC116258075 isoform X4 n=1 Tax=Nymphaea colorata TaxID=210225 RepID=UPI00129D3870|nr:uncharacterized protein LOC116258075 isoform X4 [Nymphaea colorata]
MGAMAGRALPSLGRVQLTDLIASEGLPSDSYKISMSTLSQSLAQYSAAIIQFPLGDDALLRSGLESARLFFHQRTYAATEMVRTSDPRDWCKTSGYYADPQLGQETYDFRPGLTQMESTNTMELPPAGLPDMFAVLGKAARDILDAISYSLNLRSISFMEILDNFPLRSNEISSSVLSVCCHGRSSFQAAHGTLIGHDDSQLVMFPDHEPQMDKSLITLSKSDKAGLHIRDEHGRWLLVDDLGPQEAIVYPGLALYWATAGYIKPAMHRIESRYAGAGSLKATLKKRKTSTKCKPLPPSKRLRLEAQRVLKERVQDIADKKGIKLRFCSLKECEEHIHSLDSPCLSVRTELGWPQGVPFVHPHDLPNKAKVGFLEAYEPGWAASQDMELNLIETGQASQHSAN